MPEQHNTGPDNSEKNKSSPERKRENQEKQKTFGDLFTANEKLNTNTESRNKLTGLKNDLLKSEIQSKYTTLENNPHPPTGTSPLQEEEVHPTYTLKESEFSKKFNNPVIKGCVGLGESCISGGKAIVSIGTGIMTAIPDAIAILKGAEYENGRRI